MKKIVLTFGLLSGALSAVMMWSTVPFAEQIGFDRSVIVGYTVIVISLLFVYFGMRSYRDNVLGGSMTYGQGVKVGLLITLISSACYVASWLVLFYTVMPDFADKYGAHLVATLQANGASQVEVDATIKSTAEMGEMLKNPFINAAVSFIEPFPVGLLISLISAALLRKTEANA